MKQTNDPALLKEYINKYDLQRMFTLDLSTAATLMYYETDELISQVGESESNFLILVEGECIAFVITSTGKIHCEKYYHGVNMMGMVSVLWNKPVINSVRAITPCVCLSIPMETYREALLDDKVFLQTAVEWLAAHIRKSASHFEPLEVRLASLILEMEQKGVFRPDLTLCADLLETSYRHLLRVLKAFCDKGLLQKQKRGHYGIMDRPALVALQTEDFSKAE